MKRLSIISLVLLVLAALSGCEALSQGTFMQWEGDRGGHLALVSMHVEGVGDASRSPATQHLIDAMQQKAEQELNRRFEVTPATKFVANANYRAKASTQPIGIGGVPLVSGQALASFAKNADMGRQGRLPNEVVTELARELGVRWVATVHTRWSTRLVNTSEILQRKADGSYGTSTDVITQRRASIATTVLTIYSRTGSLLASVEREAIGGYTPIRFSVEAMLADPEQCANVIKAFGRTIAQVMSELKDKPGGIEHRPQH